MSNENPSERRYVLSAAVHPETVVDWFLKLKRNWFEDKSNLFFGQYKEARQYLDSWIKTGEFAPDHTVLEIELRMKLEEWLEADWTIDATRQPADEQGG